MASHKKSVQSKGFSQTCQCCVSNQCQCQFLVAVEKDFLEKTSPKVCLFTTSRRDNGCRRCFSFFSNAKRETCHRWMLFQLLFEISEYLLAKNHNVLLNVACWPYQTIADHKEKGQKGISLDLCGLEIKKRASK